MEEWEVSEWEKRLSEEYLNNQFTWLIASAISWIALVGFTIYAVIEGI